MNPADYTFVNEDDVRWLGPCGDSFCYAGCDNPHCRWDRRLGDTPAEHNTKLRTLITETRKALDKLEGK